MIKNNKYQHWLKILESHEIYVSSKIIDKVLYLCTLFPLFNFAMDMFMCLCVWILYIMRTTFQTNTALLGPNAPYGISMGTTDDFGSGVSFRTNM